MSEDKSRGGWSAADALAWLGQRRAARPAVAAPPAAAPAPAFPADGTIANTVYFKALDALRTGRTAAAVEGAVAAAGEVADSTWVDVRPAVEARKQPGFACAAGCAWCCHQQVAVSPAEAVAIARHVRRTLAPADLAALNGRLAALDSQTRGLSVGERAHLKVPCAFLDDGRCTIYAVRPLRCRGVYSRDAGHCRWAMENPEALFGRPDRHAAPGPYPVEPAKIMDAALTGLARALRDHGLAWQALELTAALRTALDHPETAEGYPAGQPVFAGAELPAKSQSSEADGAGLAKGPE